jgi:hypothetical protein
MTKKLKDMEQPGFKYSIFEKRSSTLEPEKIKREISPVQD